MGMLFVLFGLCGLMGPVDEKRADDKVSVKVPQ